MKVRIRITGLSTRKGNAQGEVLELLPEFGTLRMESTAAENGNVAPFVVAVEREDDRRWRAHVLDLPTVTVYGDSAEAAFESAKALVLSWLAVRLEQNEALPSGVENLFKLA